MAIQKRADGLEARQTAVRVEACALMGRYPSLWEFLTAGTFADGSRRELPTLTLFIDGQALKACLNDRAEGLITFCTADTFTGILDALELGLSCDALDWRRASNGSRKK